MKRLICLLMVCSILVSFDKSAPKVLIVVREGSSQLEYMVTHEVNKMQEIIKQAGYDAKITTVTGVVLEAGSATLTPDLKFSDVNIDDYEGFMIPCMTLDTASPEMVAFVKEAVNKNKLVAAQAGGVVVLAKAGVLAGRKFALNIEPSNMPEFKNAIYNGNGVIQDGNIITSGVCPWISKDTGLQDGTSLIAQALVAAIKAKGAMGNK